MQLIDLPCGCKIDADNGLHEPCPEVAAKHKRCVRRAREYFSLDFAERYKYGLEVDILKAHVKRQKQVKRTAEKAALREGQRTPARARKQSTRD